MGSVYNAVAPEVVHKQNHKTIGKRITKTILYAPLHIFDSNDGGRNEYFGSE